MKKQTGIKKLILAKNKCAEQYGLVYTLGLLQLMINMVQQEINEELEDMELEAEDE
jgi:hypothetical protein